MALAEKMRTPNWRPTRADGDAKNLRILFCLSPFGDRIYSEGHFAIESWWSSYLDREYKNGVSLQRHLELLRNIYPALSDPIDLDYRCMDWNTH